MTSLHRSAWSFGISYATDAAPSTTREFVSIVPSSGPAAGGTSVTITFSAGSDASNLIVDVFFDGQPASTTGATDSTWTGTTPAGAAGASVLSVDWALPNENRDYGAVYTYT